MVRPVEGGHEVEVRLKADTTRIHPPEGGLQKMALEENLTRRQVLKAAIGGAAGLIVGAPRVFGQADSAAIRRGGPLPGEAGKTIIAHENTRLWLTTDVTWSWNGQRFKRLPKIAQPNKTFYTTGKLDSGIRYGYIPGRRAHRRRSVCALPAAERARRR